MNGNALRTETADAKPVIDDSFIVIFNAHHEPTTFVLPTRRFGRRRQVDVSTAKPCEVRCTVDAAGPSEGTQLPSRAELTVEARSLTILRRVQ